MITTMIEGSSSSVLAVCPICSASVEDVGYHLTTHSKEEIIESLTLKSTTSTGISEQAKDATLTSNHEQIHIPSNTGTANSISDINHPNHVISFNSDNSNVPIIPMLNNPITSLSSSLLSSNYPLERNSIMTNGTMTSVQQFASPSLPLLYRPPIPVQNVGHSANTSQLLLQNSHLNSYKAFGPSPLINSFAISPFINQPIQPSSVQLPTSTCHLQSSNASTSSAVKFQPNTELVGGQPQVSSMSNDTSPLHPQTLYCVLPYGPAIPTGGNFLLYGNNLLPSNSYIPDVSHGNNVNYILPNNNSLLMANSSNSPYFSATNFGLNKEFIAPHAPNISTRCSVADNASQTSLSNHDSMLQSDINLNHKDMSHYNADFSQASAPSSSIKKEVLKMDSSVATHGEIKTVIEIGKNIKISIPKDVLGKKERVKELINKELVRALLINDSEDLDELSETDSVDPLYSNETQEVDAFDSSGSNENMAALHALKIEQTCVNNDNSTNCTNMPENHKIAVNTYTVSCNPTSGGVINFNSIQINPNISCSSSISESHCSDSNIPLTLKNINSSEILDLNQNNNVIDLSTTSQLNSKIIFGSHPSTSSGINEIENKPNFMKYENQVGEDSCLDQPLCFLSPKKIPYFLDENTFHRISYPESKVPIDMQERKCKSPSESVKPLSCNSGDSSFQNDFMHSLHEMEKNNSVESVSTSPTKLRTYCRRKRSGSNLSTNTSNIHAIPMPYFIADSCQLNIQLQTTGTSVENEEIVDDPAYEDDMYLNNEPNDSYARDDSLSSDSIEVHDALYQRISLKMESTESNGTHTEEIMSLKASETLADSDSERATPIEEVGEIFYGKSCIFAGEPGPPHLSPRVFSHLDRTDIYTESELMGSRIDADQNFPVLFHPSISSAFAEENNGMEQEENDVIPETISVTLDANCCVFQADTLGVIQEVANLENHKLLSENWAKLPLDDFSNDQDDCKPKIASVNVESYSSSLSPHASTSGLQNCIESRIERKNFRDDEELYDFEYESDCYADSDSDAGHNHRVPLDLERWRCFKCKKTFKSLKEKLLHSGHHSNGCTYTSEETAIREEKNLLKESRKEEKLIAKEMLALSQSPSKIGGASSRKILRKTVKVELVEPVDRDTIDAQMIDSKEFKCTECSVMFASVDELYEHRANVFKSRYICPICHLEFKKRIDKIKHLKIHPVSERRCLICNRSFESLYTWSQHQLLHMGLIAFECKECGYKCRRKGELAIHYRKHSGEKPFKCDICKNTFVTNNSLKRHLITHMDGQEMECDICHKKYKNAVNLNKHKLQTHSKKRKFLKKRTDFMCPICNEIFPSGKKLAWHQETHERWPKKCQLCGECFIHQSNLTKHIRLKHDPVYIPEGNKDNQSCPVCNKIYKKSSMVQHMRIHTGDKPYKCNVCSKQFSVKCNYISHKWVHMGVRDRPLKCKLCDKSFHRKRFLESHVRSHKKIRPYTCNECGKSFIHKCNYRTHVRQHTEEKKHECEHCGKTFHRKYNLNNHVRIHTGETPYECSICRKEFTQKSNYNVHMKAFHVERHAVHEEV